MRVVHGPGPGGGPWTGGPWTGGQCYVYTPINYGQATEETNHHAKALQHDSASQKSVQQVRHRPKANKSNTPPPAAQSTQYSNFRSTETIQKCNFCRGTHEQGACPAYTRNQSSDILQHSKNRPTGDRRLKI